MWNFIRVSSLAILVASVTSLPAQNRFSELVGPVSVQPVKEATPLPVPYITWGGDAATFFANGGLTTKGGSIYASDATKLNLKLTPGDDFVKQVKDYVEGRTPFLRGTFRMLAQASEVIAADPATKPVVVLQLSWSAGDHIVGREGIKQINDLTADGKKGRIACQQGGPHVGLLYDSLSTAQIKREDIEIVWVSDLTGENGPAEAFRKDETIDACCVITPDMIGLTGGLEETGSGAEGTVRGAHVVNSTQYMSRSIADVYAVRADWFESNRDTVARFVAGYLKASDEVVRLRNDYQKSNRMAGPYRNILQMSQDIFGKEVLPTLEVDAHGLLLDCNFTRLPGQIAFFDDARNPSGFAPTLKKSLDMAVSWNYANGRFGFTHADWDYQEIAKLAGIKYERPAAPSQQDPKTPGAEITDFTGLDDTTIASFAISFEPNQFDFSADEYGAEFLEAVQAASTFGNAVMVVRGHSDPTLTLKHLINAGVERRLIKRSGKEYFFQGRPLDVTSAKTIAALIQSGKFEGTKWKPRETLQAALNLSQRRADEVKDSLAKFAADQGLNLDLSQLQPVGAGISDPLIPVPRSLAEAKKNMRVEFRIVRVPAETLDPTDFDF